MQIRLAGKEAEIVGGGIDETDLAFDGFNLFRMPLHRFTDFEIGIEEPTISEEVYKAIVLDMSARFYVSENCLNPVPLNWIEEKLASMVKKD